jgi:hypothetical protein
MSRSTINRFQEEQMRKVALTCVAAIVGALGPTAAASAIRGTQTVTVAVENNRAGTTAKPRSVGRLTVVTATTIVPGEPPWAATGSTIHFDRNLVFNSSAFPTCRQTEVQRDDSRCPRGSRVGGGAAQSTLFSRTAVSGRAASTVTAYNGPRGPLGPRLFLLVVNRSPAVRAVMVGTLKPDTGRFGRRLDIPAIPPVLQNGGLPGLTISLTRFQTSVGGRFRGRPYVALRGCTGGRLNFRGDFKFRDATGVVSAASAASTANCRRS